MKFIAFSSYNEPLKLYNVNLKEVN